MLFRPQTAHCSIIDEAIRSRVTYASVEQRPLQAARVDSIYRSADSSKFMLDVRLLATAYEARVSASKAAELWSNVSLISIISEILRFSHLSTRLLAGIVAVARVDHD